MELIAPNVLGKTGFDNGSEVQGIGCNGRPAKVPGFRFRQVWEPCVDLSKNATEDF